MEPVGGVVSAENACEGLNIRKENKTKLQEIFMRWDIFPLIAKLQ